MDEVTRRTLLAATSAAAPGKSDRRTTQEIRNQRKPTEKPRASSRFRHVFGRSPTIATVFPRLK